MTSTGPIAGKAQTVLGCVDPDLLGVTMTHEHLQMNYACAYTAPPSGDEPNEQLPFELKNLGWIRQNPYSHRPNLKVADPEAVIAELRHYKSLGGGTIVENSTVGLDGDIALLKQMSQDSGVHIIAPTGYYVHSFLSPTVRAMTEEQMVATMLSDIREGRDGTNIKCGVIGEIGCSWPLTDVERRVLRASAHTQRETGAPVIIHPGRHPTAPADIIRLLQEAGGDTSRTVMSHLDRTFSNHADLLEFAALGSYLEHDLFGVEVSHYQMDASFDMPSDAQRIDRIKALVQEGHGDRVVVAHDVHTMHRLEKFGGHGYSHILRNVVPKMLARGMKQEDINQILVNNPKAWLTFK